MGFPLQHSTWPFLASKSKMTPLILGVTCLISSTRIPQFQHFVEPLENFLSETVLGVEPGRYFVPGALAVGEGQEPPLDLELGIGPEEISALAIYAALGGNSRSWIIARTAFEWTRGYLKTYMVPCPITYGEVRPPRTLWPKTDSSPGAGHPSRASRPHVRELASTVALLVHDRRPTVATPRNAGGDRVRPALLLRHALPVHRRRFGGGARAGPRTHRARAPVQVDPGGTGMEEATGGWEPRHLSRFDGGRVRALGLRGRQVVDQLVRQLVLRQLDPPSPFVVDHHGPHPLWPVHQALARMDLLAGSGHLDGPHQVAIDHDGDSRRAGSLARRARGALRRAAELAPPVLRQDDHLCGRGRTRQSTVQGAGRAPPLAKARCASTPPCACSADFLQRAMPSTKSPTSSPRVPSPVPTRARVSCKPSTRCEQPM